MRAPGTSSSETGEVARLDHNWQVFDALVRRAERLVRRGRDERAAVAAMTAATFAWCNPSGVFAPFNPKVSCAHHTGAKTHAGHGGNTAHGAN